MNVAVGDDDQDLQRLDPGEREAILLAEQLQSTLLLVDDRKAREVAHERGLEITGLIGVLDMAAESKLVHLDTAVNRLRATNFRVSEKLLALLLKRQLR